MNTKSLLCLPVLSLGLLLPSCSDTPDYAWIPATLARTSSCEDLEIQLKNDALHKMHATIDAMIISLQASSGRGISMASDDEMATGAPQSPTVPGDEGRDHSETNIQVEGVDEADIVKTDGNYLYVLHGRTLAIVAAWPTTALELSGTTPIEGYPLEMFVTENKVVVYSRVDGQAIFQAAGLPPRDDSYGYDMPMPGGYYGSGYPALTKVTVLTKAGTVTNVEQEYYFEGDYVSARRVESQVRTVVTSTRYNQVWQSYPEGGGDADDMEDAYEELRSENIFRIASASLDDFLSHRFVKQGGVTEKLPCPCSDYYVPTTGSTQHGVTQLQSFDLDNLDAGLHETHIVGGVQTLYANTDSLYLAAAHWQSPLWSLDRPLDPVSVTATHVHKFDVSDGAAEPRYVASGSVPGLVHNQFSLDERDGMLRLATTDRVVSDQSSTSTNNMFVLAPSGGALSIVGEIKGLAPGEQIYSARFVGTRGYIVTFRQVDPLFVVDLATPTAPQLLGELKIPGFSEYMHPIAEGEHLLTLGQAGDSWGTTGNPALQIFDVTDPTHPELMHKYELPYGSSEAEQNHKAITFYRDMIALPLTRYDSSWQSSLELFDISVDTGITLRGSIEHSSFFDELDDGGYCGDYRVGIRRGVFIDDYVYSVSNGGILVNDVDDLTSPVATLDLPPITASYDCMY